MRQRRDKIDQIDKHIDQFYQYTEQKKNVIKSMELTLHLLENQNNDPVEEIEGIKLYKPESLGQLAGVDGQTAKQTYDVLKNMVQVAENQIKEL